jgi:1-hydroxy-2-naphthoate dioxygenase
MVATIQSSSDGRDAKLREFGDDIRRHALTPGWEFRESAVPAVQERAYHWSWKELLRPTIERAFAILDPEKDERRYINLANPSYATSGHPSMTRTLAAAIQAVLPGEIAPAHRHSAAALRFVISGRDAFTVVNGEVCPMSPGDLVLTPQWSWHDHANETDKPIIWLDVLDSPLISNLDQWVFEPHKGKTQARGARPAAPHGTMFKRPVEHVGGACGKNSSTYIYSWQDVEAALRQLMEANPKQAAVSVDYLNPETNGPVMTTIGAVAHQIAAGARTQPQRQSTSQVLHVVEGRGATLVGSERLEWETGDVIAIPHWHWVSHENRSTTEPAFLFSATDAPLIEAIGLYREETSALLG